MRAARQLLPAIATVLAVAQPALVQGQAHRARFDRAIADSLAAGDQTQRVIITVKPGFRDGIRDALKKHGDIIKSEHPSVESIAAVVHSGDVADLANHPGVQYVSSDATVFAGATRWKA